MLHFQLILDPLNFGIFFSSKLKHLLHPLNPLQPLLQKRIFFPQSLILCLNELDLFPQLLTVFGLEVHIFIRTGGLLGRRIEGVVAIGEHQLFRDALPIPLAARRLEIAVDQAVILGLARARLFVQVDHQLGNTLLFWPTGVVLLAAVVPVQGLREVISQPLVLAVQLALQDQRFALLVGVELVADGLMPNSFRRLNHPFELITYNRISHDQRVTVTRSPPRRAY